MLLPDLSSADLRISELMAESPHTIGFEQHMSAPRYRTNKVFNRYALDTMSWPLHTALA
jgi:hypothetical protein